MRAEYVASLVKGVSEVFEAMLNAETTSGTMVIRTGKKSPECIGACLSFGGPAKGVVALFFPAGTANNVARILTNVQARVPREMLVDCVVEFVGMIVARSGFREFATTPVQAWPPDTEVHEETGTELTSGDAALEIPFESNVGPFSLQISLDVRA